MLFTSFTASHDLPQGLLSALCHVESKHQVSAFVAHDGSSPSYGVCQIKLATARSVGFKGQEKDLMQPSINIKYAAKYLKRQLNRYNGDTRKAVAAYNAGTYFEKNKRPANFTYVRKVFSAWLANR